MIAGRYVIGESFASGGVGTIHLGRARGAGGFSRVVAIKRLFPSQASDGAFREMLLREGRLASRIRHPNVVPTLDVVETDADVYVVMEYVHGVSLSRLLKTTRAPMPVAVALGITVDLLAGLHAAHEARSEDGLALGLVHRDVSPQNVLVGADGVARLIDFGIAKAASHHAVTEPGVIKGKTAYMAPEQLRSEAVSRHADVFAVATVLWEMLTGRALIDEHTVNPLMARMTQPESAPPSRHRPEVDARVDRVVMRALAFKPADRYPTADAMAAALRGAGPIAHAGEIASWLEKEAADDLEISEERVRLMERSGAEDLATSPSPAGLAPADGDEPEARSQPQGASLEIAERTEPTDRPAKRWARRAAPLSAALLLGAIGVFALRARDRAPAPPAAAVVETPSEAPPAPVATASADKRDEPAPSAVANAASITPAPAASEAAPRAKTATPARRGKGRCSPPYTLDSSGRRHYDPSCF